MFSETHSSLYKATKEFFFRMRPPKYMFRVMEGVAQ